MEETQSQQENGAHLPEFKFYAPTVLTRENLGSYEGKSDLRILGPLTIAPNISVEEFERKVGRITVMGPLAYPSYMEEVVRPKVAKVVGPMDSYLCPYCERVYIGTLILDEAYLQGIPDKTNLAVFGGLRLPNVLDNEVLARKIDKLYVSNGIRVSEENAPLISRLLVKSRKLVVIPGEYKVIETPLVLDKPALEALPGGKIYCTERVEIKTDVDSKSLDKNLEALKCTDYVFCPVHLMETLYRKVKWQETRVMEYEGELWIIDEGREMPIYALQYLEGKATLVVFNELRLSKDIDAQLITDKLAKVHNLGDIYCSSAQEDALRSILGLCEGDFLDPASHHSHYGEIHIDDADLDD